MEKQCELCKKHFTTPAYKPHQRFCCVKCSRTYNMRKIAGKNKNGKKLTCTICGNEYYRPGCRCKNSRFCSKECQNLSKGKDHHLYRKNGSKWRYRFLFDPFPKHCQFCGTHINDLSRLEVHHIDKNRNNNEKSNLIVLCPSCHKKADHGTLVRFKCQNCGKYFYPQRSLSNPRKFCSRECYVNSRK